MHTKTQRVTRRAAVLAAVVVMAGAGVLAWHVGRERAHWWQVRSQMVLSEVYVTQWHPTRNEVIGVVGYADAESHLQIECRVAAFSPDGSTRLLTSAHRDGDPRWNAAGTQVLFERQRQNFTWLDLQLFRRFSRHWTWPGSIATARMASKSVDRVLCVRGERGRTRVVGPKDRHVSVLQAAWLAATGGTAAVATRRGYEGQKLVWTRLPQGTRGEYGPALPEGFFPVALQPSPSDGRFALDGSVFLGEPLKREGAAVCVVDPAAGTVRQVLQREDLVPGALQWLGPPANALVTREHTTAHGADPMPFFWINTQDWTVNKLTVPSFPGYSYKIGRWSPSGQAVALTASQQASQRNGSEVLLLWKRGWKQPRLLHQGKRLASIVWSPDERQLAVGEDRVHVRFIAVPPD